VCSARESNIVYRYTWIVLVHMNIVIPTGRGLLTVDLTYPAAEQV
jgi:hypothetical protein